MPKHVGVGTYHRLCFMIVIYCISLSAFVGQRTEYAKMHGISDVKLRMLKFSYSIKLTNR